MSFIKCGLCFTGFYAFAPPVFGVTQFRECVSSLASNARTLGSFPFKLASGLPASYIIGQQVPYWRVRRVLLRS